MNSKIIKSEIMVLTERGKTYVTDTDVTMS
jgi:hypothetical protein